MNGTARQRAPRGGRWSRSNRRRDDAARRERRAAWLTLGLGVPALGVLVFTLFFGERGLVRFMAMADHQDQLKEDIAALKAGNSTLRSEIERLRTDPETIEGIARERLGMGRRGEVVYRFDPRAPESP